MNNGDLERNLARINGAIAQAAQRALDYLDNPEEISRGELRQSLQGILDVICDPPPGCIPDLDSHQSDPSKDKKTKA